MKKKKSTATPPANSISELQETISKAQAILMDPEKYKIHRARAHELFPALKEIEERFQASDQRMEDSHKKWDEEHPEQANCDHGVVFDEEEANRLCEQIQEKGSDDPAVNFIMGAPNASAAVRKRWPRLHGSCPKGCGFNGIAYASTAHYLYGDW